MTQPLDVAQLTDRNLKSVHLVYTVWSSRRIYVLGSFQKRSKKGRMQPRALAPCPRDRRSAYQTKARFTSNAEPGW